MAQTMGEGLLNNNPTPPIFIVDGLDVGVFGSIEDAVLQLEAVDVQRGEYSAYDAEGRLLRLTVDGSKVNAQLAETQAFHAEELSTALREFLRAMGEVIADDPECDLTSLVETSKKFTYASPTFWPFRKRG